MQKNTAWAQRQPGSVLESGAAALPPAAWACAAGGRGGRRAPCRQSWSHLPALRAPLRPAPQTLQTDLQLRSGEPQSGNPNPGHICQLAPALVPPSLSFLVCKRGCQHLPRRLPGTAGDQGASSADGSAACLGYQHEHSHESTCAPCPCPGAGSRASICAHSSFSGDPGANATSDCLSISPFADWGDFR